MLGRPLARRRVQAQIQPTGSGWGSRTTETPASCLQDAINDYAAYIEDAFGGHASEVCAAGHAVLAPVDAHVRAVGVAPGLFARRVEFDPCPGERDADDERIVVRLEFASQVSRTW
jgi:hypothetical protein